MFDSQSEFCLRNARRRHAILVLALFPALAALSSCGSSNTTTTPSISLTGAASTVNVNGTVQFTAIISNLSSTLANYEVNGTLGGNTTYGTINSNGLYTAPATVPAGSANVITITAIAQAQTSLTATATVTIEPPASITQITPPSPVTVSAGQQTAFTATFSSGTGNGVYWYINNSSACSTTLGYPNGQVPVTGGFTYPYGKMTSQGVYTAPVIPPAGGAIALTAVSQADAKQTLCEVVNLTFGNASLQGSFVFSSTGRVISSNRFFARAGSFTAAGGAIIGGLETYNEVGLAQAAQSPNPWVGSYNIGADGRGTMEFCESTTGGACNDAMATAFFRVLILNSQQVQITEFSPNGSSVAQRTGSGELIAQATPLPSPGLLALNGAYTFSLAGDSSSANTVSVIGEFSADGQGNIGTNPISRIPGLMDINDSSRTTPLSSVPIASTSFYSIPSNGKGTVTLQTSDPVYSQLVLTIYVVSSGRAKFIESDGISVLAGDIYEQQTSGVSCTWGPNLLNGPLVIATLGGNANGEVADLISIKADGAGNAAAVSNYENSAGTVTNGTSLSGTYTVGSTGATCGAGTLTLGTSPANHNYDFFMISSSDVVIQETTSGVVAFGHLVAPATGTPALGTLNSFALNLQGRNAAGASANREDIIGQINTDATGKVIANTTPTAPGPLLVGSVLDINNFGNTQNDPLASGTLDLTGATPASLKDAAGVTRTFVLYPVSATQYYVLGTDTTDVAFGSLYQQF